MEGRVIVGLDLSRRAQHQAVVLRGAQARPGARLLHGTVEELERLVAAAGGPERCGVVMEPMGMAWLPVSAWLLHRGCTVYRVDTRSTSSKQARAEPLKKQVGRASNAQGTGQSEDSPRRSHEVSARPGSNPSPA